MRRLRAATDRLKAETLDGQESTVVRARRLAIEACAVSVQPFGVVLTETPRGISARRVDV